VQSALKETVMPLEVTTPSDTSIVVTRSFDAPRQLVWDCHTKPELVRRWLCDPTGWTMPVCEIDLRVGGAYRYRWRNEKTGFEFGCSGVHLAIAEPARIVTSERMEGFEGESHNTLLLTETGGRTLLTLSMEFGSKEGRDAAIKSGMTDGMEQCYARIETEFINA
jgi:uncharacterized protein YndB with AHSA1/START domain